ncbi:MAG: WG repeat-containing protein [Bacteroidota bacterium]
MLGWLLLLSVIGISGCDSIGLSQEERYMPVKDGNYYGFIDNSGNMVISPQFAYGIQFSEGLAGVNVGGTPGSRDMPEDGKWGFINENGRLVINPLYYSPPNTGSAPYDPEKLPLSMHMGYQFKDSLAAVWLENRWVYIGHTGDTLISYAYILSDSSRYDTVKKYPILSARIFKEDRAAVYTQDGWGYIDKEGQLVIPPKYLFPIEFNNGYAVLMNKDRQFVCIDRYGRRHFSQYKIESNFSEGIAPMQETFIGEKPRDSDQYKVGLMDTSGLVLILAQFDKVGRFGAGLCPVLVGSDKKKPALDDRIETLETDGGKWGYVDNSGVYRINPVFDGAKGFREGLAAAKRSSRWGYINTSGKWVVDPQFKFAGYFTGGIARVKLSEVHDIYDNKYAFINTNGDIIWIDKE